MKRLQIKLRPNWQAEVERLGLTFHTDLENDVVEQSPAGRIVGDVSGHPNLLEAHLDGPHGLAEYVKKPLLSREGPNITLHTRNSEVSTPGPYGKAFGKESYVYQALGPWASFDGTRPILGSW